MFLLRAVFASRGLHTEEQEETGSVNATNYSNKEYNVYSGDAERNPRRSTVSFTSSLHKNALAFYLSQFGFSITVFVQVAIISVTAFWHQMNQREIKCEHFVFAERRTSPVGI